MVLKEIGRRGWLAAAVAALAMGAGCRHAGPVRAVAPAPPPLPHWPSNKPLKLTGSRDWLTRSILDGLKRRIRGRRDSLRDVSRTVQEIGPLVEEAALQPQAQAVFDRMALEMGIAPDQARERWVRLQEADLLLEAGGDPDSLSTAKAAGAAQWLAGTAAGAGLHVDRRASDMLTQQIDALSRRAAWLRYLHAPGADVAAPGAPSVTVADQQALPALEAEIERLKAERRAVDSRYDPRQAIFAQTRYLLRLYTRFPSPDWIFQAYHGGEAGVERTLKFYLGSRWHGSTAAAIRTGNRGRRLSYEDVYFSTSPRSHAAAFEYLYSRSDDHRHYWWKLRASEEALADYRRDPAAFAREWATYLPGRMTDAWWYPWAEAEAMGDVRSLEEADRSKRLVPVRSGADFAVRGPEWDAAHAADYAEVRPSSRGALLLLVGVYRKAGGTGPIGVGDLALTREYLTAVKQLHPPLHRSTPPSPPDPNLLTTPGGGPSPRFDAHTAGIAVDVLRPADAKRRAALEYALDSLQDRQIIAWVDAKDRGERRFHFSPNPLFGDALERISAQGRAPSLPAF